MHSWAFTECTVSPKDHALIVNHPVLWSWSLHQSADGQWWRRFAQEPGISKTNPFDQWVFGFRKPYLDRSANISWCSGVRGIDESVLVVAELFMRANLSRTPSINQRSVTPSWDTYKMLAPMPYPLWFLRENKSLKFSVVANICDAMVLFNDFYKMQTQSPSGSLRFGEWSKLMEAGWGRGWKPRRWSQKDYIQVFVLTL